MRQELPTIKYYEKAGEGFLSDTFEKGLGNREQGVEKRNKKNGSK